MPSDRAYDERNGLSIPTDDSALKEIRELYDYDTDQWAKIREEAAKDMLCVAGRVWDAMDPKGKRHREDLNRPYLSLDELSQYSNQAINDVRANARAIKYTANGNGATDQTAEFYANKVREIEYRSRAQIVYTTAFQNCIERSYGFCRVMTKYAHRRSWNQDLWLAAIVNPDLVTPDADAIMPDSSDMKRCVVAEVRSIKQFKRDFPKAKVVDFGAEAMKIAPSWIRGEKIVLAEIWKIRMTKRKLLLVQKPSVRPPEGMLGNLREFSPDPEGYFEDEIKALGGLPQGWRVLRTEERDDREVYQCLTNGLEILEQTPWLGHYIPIASCYGKVIYADLGSGPERSILSMTRLARDPLMLYCYYRTQQAEMAGMIPKAPVVGYKGQFRGMEEAWQKNPHEPMAYLEALERTESTPPGMLLPLPQRLAYSPGEHIAALEICAEGARRAIQAAMGGAPLPTAAQRRTEKSGIALERIENATARGSYHFVDSYNAMIEAVGVILEDLMDKIYDSARDVPVRLPNDKAETIRINDPRVDKSISTKGEHAVTVSVGPAQDSEREAASDFADTLAQISPQVFTLLGPLIVRLKNLGPIGDEMAQLLETLQPPEVRALKQQGDKANPQQLAAELTATKAQLQQVMQAATEMAKKLETDALKQQATIEQAKINAELQIKLQHLKNAASIRTAEIAAAVKGYTAEAAHAADHEAQALDREHEAVEAELDRQHEDHRAEREHQHAIDEAEHGVVGQIAVAQAKPTPAEKGASA